LQGVLQAWIGAEYFALRGMNFRAETQGSRVSAGFGLSRPGSRFDETLTLVVNVDHTSVERAKHFIPYKLPAGLPEWLEQGPRAGQLSAVAFAYHGQIHTRPFELARRVELSARIDDGEVRYHADWPEVTGLDGKIAVAGREVRIDVEEGFNSGGENIANSRIVLGDNASYADIDLSSRMNLAQALAFVRTTPLSRWMAFITPGWSGEGMLDMRGRMHIPLKLDQSHIGELEVEDELAIDLEIDLDGVDLSLAEYRVELGALEGNLRYRFPHRVEGSGLSGRLFERPATFAAQADEDTVIFRVNGQAAYEDILSTLDMADPGNLRGGFDFQADLYIELGEDISRLRIESDLAGLAISLPGGLAKRVDDAVPAEMDVRFLDDYQSLSFRYGPAAGWLHVDATPMRGSIGISGPPPLVDMSRNELAIGGHIKGFAIEEVIPDSAASVEDGQQGGSRLPIDLRLVDLQAEHIGVGTVRFPQARLNGRVGAADLQVEVDSPDLVGRVAMTGTDPVNVHLQLLRLPGDDVAVEEGSETEDPLDPELIRELARADVQVDSFLIGERDYGTWSFGLVPDARGLAITDLRAVLRGVSITADRLYWQAEPNETLFEGSLAAGNLAEVLPLWGYAPSLITERAALTGKLSWRGSPAMVDLPRLEGLASFSAENGRFLDVEAGGTGALRIFSLINFSTIAKRLKLDFSDVSGEGVSFDSLSATAQFEDNRMSFVEPLMVLGSGSNFRIAGDIDLQTQQLRNEMVVTLPVSRSLPWYAAYIAIANPLAGLGVLVGERVLRKPLEQFSSAKYQISGTLQDPELKFVGVWDTSMDQPQSPHEPQPEIPDQEAEQHEPGDGIEALKLDPGNRQLTETTESHTG
ncbi:MAG: hypothetical protein KDI31_13250, partial [Pseudomonadales bacterium]|nr:hypothetical protein [Pseudomonadales bacterium]